MVNNFRIKWTQCLIDYNFYFKILKYRLTCISVLIHTEKNSTYNINTKENVKNKILVTMKLYVIYFNAL